MSKKIGIVMGSDSDLPIVKKAIDMLDTFGVGYEVHVYSAHRTPDEAGVFASNARKNGFFNSSSICIQSYKEPPLRYTSLCEIGKI